MVLVFNELSHSFTWNDGEAKSFYDTFFNLCKDISKKYGRKIEFIHFVKKGSATVFEIDVQFKKWLSSTSNEIKSFVLSTLTGTQKRIDYPYFKVDGREGMGVAYAYENDEMILSFNSDAKWSVDFLTVGQEEVVENDEIQIQISSKDIYNSYHEKSIETHSIFFCDKIKFYSNQGLNNIKQELNKGKLLWSKKEEVFPNLIFCSTVKDYIENIQSGAVLINLLQRLYEYNLYFETWSDGDFEIKKLKGNPRLESDTRIRKHSELLVLCPDGQNREFSFHCNYGFSDTRLHFVPFIPEVITEKRKCIIGYIGKKIV